MEEADAAKIRGPLSERVEMPLFHIVCGRIGAVDSDES